MEMKEAFEKAKNEFYQVYPKDQVLDLRLEEAEEEYENWNIVISFLWPNKNINQTPSLSNILSSSTLPYERIYKKIIVDSKGKAIIKIYSK